MLVWLCRGDRSTRRKMGKGEERDRATWKHSCWNLVSQCCTSTFSWVFSIVNLHQITRSLNMNFGQIFGVSPAMIRGYSKTEKEIRVETVVNKLISLNKKKSNRDLSILRICRKKIWDTADQTRKSRSYDCSKPLDSVLFKVKFVAASFKSYHAIQVSAGKALQ